MFVHSFKHTYLRTLSIARRAFIKLSTDFGIRIVLSLTHFGEPLSHFVIVILCIPWYRIDQTDFSIIVVEYITREKKLKIFNHHNFSSISLNF